MGFFTRKSRWDQVVETAASAAAKKAVRDGSKVTLSVVGGAIAATAASAAVSVIRHKDEA